MDTFDLNRRSFVGGTVAATLLSSLREEAKLCGSEGEGRPKLFWGDLHNHNAVGYAQGSLRRSIELAREHLDFFAFTATVARLGSHVPELRS